MTDDEIIAVVTAHKEGKKIQARRTDQRVDRPLVGWMDLLGGGLNPDQLILWNFEKCEYRVAPEPRKPREWMAYVDEGKLLPFNLTFAPEDLIRYKAIRVREVIE